MNFSFDFRSNHVSFHPLFWRGWGSSICNSRKGNNSFLRRWHGARWWKYDHFRWEYRRWRVRSRILLIRIGYWIKIIDLSIWSCISYVTRLYINYTCRWHRIALSIKGDSVTMIHNCETQSTKPLVRSTTSTLATSGIITIAHELAEENHFKVSSDIQGVAA